MALRIGFEPSVLFKAPKLNPINRKARSIPALNPINMYGRVFFFSWFGFMIAFWAWFTFPPLLTVTIKKDLKLKPAQIANSNIVSLCATLLIRLLSGPLCDQFGPRLVFGCLLLLGAIPVGLAPLVQNAGGLYAIRFFIGILGGTFVPCQVWSTAFFDKNVVGTANALTGGLGNAGGGITYFIMPAVFDSFVHHGGYTADKAWRLTFIVPLLMVLCTGAALLLLCPDTPDGPWSERQVHVQQHLEEHGVKAAAADAGGGGGSSNAPEDGVHPGVLAGRAASVEQEKKADAEDKGGVAESSIAENDVGNDLDNDPATTSSSSAHQLSFADREVRLGQTEMLETAQGEVVVAPTGPEALRVALSPQTWALVLTYMCSFGVELAIDATLASYYLKNFPHLGQTGASNWAAMFGFLNVATRPLGGVISDLLYNYSHNRGGGHGLWLKKHWITVCGCLSGVLLIVVGRVDSHDESTMYGLVALAAIFIEAGNGANFSLVPHVHPFANGIVSGLAGAGGNLGGVLFAIIFRFMGSGTDYAKAFWVIGIIHLAVNLTVAWIPPLPQGQIGGH